MNNEVDIIALVNYNDYKQKLYIYSGLPTINNEKITNYTISNSLKSYANKIMYNLNLSKFTFIHIRRGDILDNYVHTPPKGTRPFTSAEFVTNFIKEKTKNKTIIVATDENDLNYKKKIIKLLNNYKVIFEEEYYKYLPDNISNDNYCIYLISD